MVGRWLLPGATQARRPGRVRVVTAENRLRRRTEGRFCWHRTQLASGLHRVGLKWLLRQEMERREDATISVLALGGPLCSQQKMKTVMVVPRQVWRAERKPSGMRQQRQIWDRHHSGLTLKVEVQRLGGQGEETRGGKMPAAAQGSLWQARREGAGGRTVRRPLRAWDGEEGGGWLRCCSPTRTRGGGSAHPMTGARPTRYERVPWDLTEARPAWDLGSEGALPLERHKVKKEQ